MELYIHIPFCKKKCRYCSFTSFTGRESDYEAYIDLLLKEAEKRSVEADEPVRTVYIGGGTPSVLEPDLFHQLMTKAYQCFPWEHTAEVSVEMNPGTISDTFLKTALTSGVNRVSLGAQSASDRLLKMLGRIHTSEDIGTAVCKVKEIGISNFNLDMMIGLSGQKMNDVAETLGVVFSANIVKPSERNAQGAFSYG